MVKKICSMQLLLSVQHRSTNDQTQHMETQRRKLLLSDILVQYEKKEDRQKGKHDGVL